MLLALRFAARARSAVAPGAAARRFHGLPLLPELRSAVDELMLEEATPIQGSVIPKLLAGEDVVFGSHTGSGKTLAYLLPLMQRLKEAEVQEQLGMPRPYRPRAAVLVPSRELCLQVTEVAKHLAHHAKCRVQALTGGQKKQLHKRALKAGLDMVVATPGRFMWHREQGHLMLSDLRALVVDEVDTMLDDKFGVDVRALARALQRRAQEGGERCQFVLAGATFTPQLRRLLASLFPAASLVTTPSMHRPSSTLRERFVPYAGLNKYTQLLEVLRSLPPSDSRHTLVFCNTSDSCRATQHVLAQHGFGAASLHGEIPPHLRSQNFEAFVAGAANVLVCTDIAARGLDLARVDHVVNFDFPRNSVEYLHRAGRTARAGRPGTVTSVYTKQERALAHALQRAASAPAQAYTEMSLGVDGRGNPIHQRFDAPISVEDAEGGGGGGGGGADGERRARRRRGRGADAADVAMHALRSQVAGGGADSEAAGDEAAAAATSDMGSVTRSLLRRARAAAQQEGAGQVAATLAHWERTERAQQLQAAMEEAVPEAARPALTRFGAAVKARQLSHQVAAPAPSHSARRGGLGRRSADARRTKSRDWMVESLALGQGSARARRDMAAGGSQARRVAGGQAWTPAADREEAAAEARGGRQGQGGQRRQGEQGGQGGQRKQDGQRWQGGQGGQRWQREKERAGRRIVIKASKPRP